ncbi:MAG: 7TM-DISM domain-containing protein, partial [Desulfosudis oleivorans]|nr:7TM-DISM domain-containing protein [Desulfosudis oleivorans]
MPAVLWNPQTFIEKNHDEQFVLGIYYGIVLAMLVYNLLLYLSIRDPIYLYYVSYISAFVLLQLTLNGLAFEYLWPTLPVWNGHALVLFLFVAILLATQFTRALLETRRVLPRTDRAMLGFTVLMGVGAARVAVGRLPHHDPARHHHRAGWSRWSISAWSGWFAGRGRQARRHLPRYAWTIFLMGAAIYPASKASASRRRCSSPTTPSRSARRSRRCCCPSPWPGLSIRLASRLFAPLLRS